MAPIGCDIMDYASPHEGQQGSTLTGLAQSFRLQSPFLGDYSLHQASPMSPVSALGHGFNSPGLLSGVEPALAPSNATASTTMSQNELNERLQQLLALQQVQQTSPMQQTGYENLSHAQLLPLLTGGDLEASEQLSELLALQAALGASSPTSNGSGRVGPNANPLYKTELCRSWEEFGSCRYGIKCQFAHSREELRPVNRHPKYKTEVCRTFATTGTCPYGTRCRFIHQSAALAQLRIATGNTPRAGVKGESPFTSNNSIAGSPVTDAMLVPALANILQQAQAQHAQQQQQQYSPNSSNGNLPSLSPVSFYQQQQNQNDIATNGGMHSASSFGSLLGMNTANNNGLNNGFSDSSPAVRAVGDPFLSHNDNGNNNNKLSVSVDYQQQQNHNLSAPCTPHGNVSLSLQGLMRRSTSDNALPVTPTTGTANGLGAVGTPTSGRRLPIFSTLVEGDANN
ncbi:hypothetical protein Ndes2437B_g04666 [Nannochloris sp. 'desiccata']|nr:hypothetical protein KSW81_004449 [Chlorella desiccata (nom. nud.)]